jgi:hypothetical protein
MLAASRTLIERYRCPETFLNLSIKNNLGEQRGFFRFGDITCYGRCSGGVSRYRVDSVLYDVAQEVVLSNSDSAVYLPFDPTETVDNLRLERYVGALDSAVRAPARKIYYFLRPIFPFSVRKQIQKFQLRSWRRLPFPSWPVDHTVENICEELLLLAIKASGADRIPFIWFWPEGASSALMMTHDVDTEAGRNFCSELMDIDDSFGIKASFQIVPERRYSVSSLFLVGIRQRGFEIAVHGLRHDGLLFDDRKKFLRSAKLINEYVRAFGAKGFRAPVLYRRPDWYDAFDFSFDMSIPNTAHLDPQRGGCCTVMPYFIGHILELPVTTTQDYMLFHLLGERSIDLWKRQIELIVENNGLISFIAHPDYVMRDGFKSVYEDLLEYLRELQLTRGTWVTLPSEVDRWWRARSKMQLVSRGGQWYIDGECAERAVVAYARNVDGELIYEVEPTCASLAKPTRINSL